MPGQYTIPLPFSSLATSASPAAPSSGAPARGRHIASVALAVSFASIALTGWNLRLRFDAEHRTASLSSQLRPAASQFASEADHQVRIGNLAGARNQLQLALALQPENAQWTCRLGDVLESCFDFAGAMEAYRKAMSLDPSLSRASEGFILCGRLTRANESSAHPSEGTLYALHRSMLKQGRLAEATRIAERLAGDCDLLCDTWKARLKADGLDATVQTAGEGKLSVVLTGAVQNGLEALRDMPLAKLSIASTDVRDLRPLEGIAIEELDLSRTAVMDLSPLHRMPLRVLSIERTLVADLEPLRGMRLRQLNAAGSQIRSVVPLESMPLRSLDISGTAVADVKALATIPLFGLNLSNTRVADISPLANLPLTTLTLSDTFVVDISALKNAPLLELSLARTKVSDLTPLSRSSVEALDLVGCTEIRDLRPLAHCQKLQRLLLPSEQADLSPLSAHPRLTVVR